MTVDRYSQSRGVGGDTVHEELNNNMFMIDPTETRLLSAIERETVESTKPEWLVERLNSPMFNAYPDGGDFDLLKFHAAGSSATPNQAGWDGGQNAITQTYSQTGGVAAPVGLPVASNPFTNGTGVPAFDGAGITGSLGQAPGYNQPERVGTYCQISRKEVVVTRRAEKANTAGRRSELGRIRARRALELRRDMEMIALSNQPARPGQSMSDSGTYDVADAPWTAGVPAWIGASRAGTQSGTGRYNTFSEATENPSDDPVLNGGGGVYGIPTTACDETSPGAPTLGPLQEINLLSIHATVHEQGGKPTVCMVPFTFKQKISQYLFSDPNARVMAQNQDHGGNPGSVMVQGAVDYYQTDYGKIQMVPNRWMRPTDVLLLDYSKWAIGIHDGLKREKIGKRKDAYEEMMLIDWCLICRHEGANGIIRDVDITADVVN